MACSFRLFVAVLLVSKAEGICNSGDVRLEGGSVPNEGRVEVCIGEEWGTVCDDDFGPEEASIVCKQLGFSRNDAMVLADSTQFGLTEVTTDIFMDSVTCVGNEHKLIDCDYDTNHDCFHFEDVGIHCGICDNGAIQLVNDSSEIESTVTGRVEICWNNTWGAVCDRNWTDTDTAVVCKQLGFSQCEFKLSIKETTAVIKPAKTPNTKLSNHVWTLKTIPPLPLDVSSYSSAQGSDLILLQNVACNGTEERLMDCPHSGTCTHHDDVGVICLSQPQAPTTGEVRRISASKIKVTWEPGSQGDLSTDYTVKYYPLNSSSSENLLVQFITTNETELVIQDLNPFLSYSVSVAATNAAGMGDYSSEATVEVLESRFKFFQIFFSGSINCKEWIMFDAEIKLEHVKNNLKSDLASTCTCDLTSELEEFYFNDPLCLPAHPQVIVVWGSVFGTDTCESAEIMNCLQDQVEAETEHSVKGVNLKTLKYCTVYLDEGEMPSCDIKPTETVKGEESTASPIPYIIATVVVVLALFVVGGTCIFACRRKLRCRKATPPKAIPLEKVYEEIPPAAGRSAAYQDSVINNDGAYSSDKPICTERA